MYKNKIKVYRELKGLTLKELEEKSGVSAGYLCHLERGNRDNLWLYTNITSTATEGYMPETDYLQHINLGLTAEASVEQA